jgi:DNA invertase Pin-like site-specific DNA recombinase
MGAQNSICSKRASSEQSDRKLHQNCVRANFGRRSGVKLQRRSTREGDTVVVWKLDRLSRSLKEVLHILERIAQAGAGFRSLTENVDTTTPAGRMMMQMVGAFAEFERAMIRERTSAGLVAARA